MKYSAKFKLQVVKFAQESNNCAAGREFCVNEKLIRDWRKQVEKLKCMPKNKCSNRGKTFQWPELEDKLLQWIEEQRLHGYMYIVTRNMIIIKAKAVAAELQIPVTGFLASNCWCTKFLRRKNLALRQKKKIAQKLPEDPDQKITVCLWVLDAWRSLPAEMVARSFKKCGISNSMDGTEDEILWEETEEVPTTPVDEEDEGVYADHLTSAEWQNLFGNSDDEEFAGFE